MCIGSWKGFVVTRFMLQSPTLLWLFGFYELYQHKVAHNCEIEEKLHLGIFLKTNTKTFTQCKYTTYLTNSYLRTVFKNHVCMSPKQSSPSCSPAVLTPFLLLSSNSLMIRALKLKWRTGQGAAEVFNVISHLAFSPKISKPSAGSQSISGSYSLRFYSLETK